jgi:hypothetical protein
MKSNPLVYCDLNARMTDSGYLLTNGSLTSLSALGLTPESAQGLDFRFGDGELMFDGTIKLHPTFGYLAEASTPVVDWAGAAPTFSDIG